MDNEEASNSTTATVKSNDVMTNDNDIWSSNTRVWSSDYSLCQAPRRLNLFSDDNDDNDDDDDVPSGKMLVSKD